MQTETKDITGYIKMVTGLSVDVGIDESTKDTIVVTCDQLEDLEQLLSSWCTYHNCLSSSTHGVVISWASKNKVSIKKVTIGSIRKNICHSAHGVYLYKVYSVQITADGKLKKKALRYNVEIDGSKEKYDVDISQRATALKIYKSIIRHVKYETGELTEA